MYGENNPEQKEKMRSCNLPEKINPKLSKTTS